MLAVPPNFYVSTPNYNRFKGVDLVPERKDDYKQADFNGDLYYKNFNFEDARYFNEPNHIREVQHQFARRTAWGLSMLAERWRDRMPDANLR